MILAMSLGGDADGCVDAIRSGVWSKELLGGERESRRSTSAMSVDSCVQSSRSWSKLLDEMVIARGVSAGASQVVSSRR